MGTVTSPTFITRSVIIPKHQYMTVSVRGMFWGVIHKLVLAATVILFPVVLALDKIGIGKPYFLSEALEYLNVKYKQSHDFNS